MNNTIRVNHIIHNSNANGKGIRTTIWTQGCTLKCPDCFNQELWDKEGGYEITPAELIKILPKNIEGITISGGEPFQQRNLLGFINEFHLLRPKLTIIVFSGYNFDELTNKYGFWKIMDSKIDVIITGRYIKELHIADRLRGSSNKQYNFLTMRIKKEDFNIPNVEIQISKNQITFTGMMNSKEISDQLQKIGIVLFRTDI